MCVNFNLFISILVYWCVTLSPCVSLDHSRLEQHSLFSSLSPPPSLSLSLSLSLSIYLWSPLFFLPPSFTLFRSLFLSFFSYLSIFLSIYSSFIHAECLFIFTLSFSMYVMSFISLYLSDIFSSRYPVLMNYFLPGYSCESTLTKSNTFSIKDMNDNSQPICDQWWALVRDLLTLYQGLNSQTNVKTRLFVYGPSHWGLKG